MGRFGGLPSVVAAVVVVVVVVAVVRPAHCLCMCLCMHACTPGDGGFMCSFVNMYASMSMCEYIHWKTIQVGLHICTYVCIWNPSLRLGMSSMRTASHLQHTVIWTSTWACALQHMCAHVGSSHLWSRTQSEPLAQCSEMAATVSFNVSGKIFEVAQDTIHNHGENMLHACWFSL